jgi:hypothetical protein
MHKLYEAATPPIQTPDSSKGDSNEQDRSPAKQTQSSKQKTRSKRPHKTRNRGTIFSRSAQPISVRVNLDRGYLERLLQDQISSSSDKI